MESINKKAVRIAELDFLRGFAIIMMILHHLIYDLRYIMNLDVFAWQESFVFLNFIRPPFVFAFVFVSGVCCSFSRNNYRRALKLGLVALLFSAVFYIISAATGDQMYVVFNVLHVLAAGTLLYSLIESISVIKKNISPEKTFFFLSLAFTWLYIPFSRLEPIRNIILAPVHENFSRGIGMADYLPLIPWVGFFFAGAFFGMVYYREKKSLFGKPGPYVRKISEPFEFVGRNALVFYVFHQPVILGVLFFLRFLGII